MNLFDLGLEDVVPEKRDPLHILADLMAAPCRDCELARINPKNPGFLSRGNVNAQIAALSDVPLEEDMMHRSVLQSFGRREWLRWLKELGLNEKDVFATYTVHCMTQAETTTKTKKAGKFDVVTAKVQPPDKADISACFYRRTLKVLQSLPNLKLLLALGATAIETVLDVDYAQKKHEGNFYLTDRLPGIIVYALEHPRDYESGGLVKRNRVDGFLDILYKKFLLTDSIQKIYQVHANARAHGVEADLNCTL